MKFKILILILPIILLTSCTNVVNKKNLNTTIVNKQNFILLNSENIEIGKLTTTNNWKTADFTTLDKKTYTLNRTVSADGIKLSNSSLSIHFKGNKGILEKDNIINYFKIN